MWPGSRKVLTHYVSLLQFSSPPPVQQLEFFDSSPMFLRRSSLTSSLNDDEDDGFLDVLDDNMEVRAFQLHWYLWQLCICWMGAITDCLPVKDLKTPFWGTTEMTLNWKIHVVVGICPFSLYLSDRPPFCSLTERLWDANGNGQLAHCPTGGRQHNRRLCKFIYYEM